MERAPAKPEYDAQTAKTVRGMFAEIKSQGLQPHPVSVKLMKAVSIIVFEKPAKDWQQIRETLFTDSHLHNKLLA